MKDKLSELFGYPMLNSSYATYLDFMNKSGKITPRSIMDILAIALEKIEELDKREATQIVTTPKEDGLKLDKTKRKA